MNNTQSIVTRYRQPAFITLCSAVVILWPMAQSRAQQAEAPPKAPVVQPGSSFFTGPNSLLLGSFTALSPVKLIEKKDGWSHLQLDVWVRDEALNATTGESGITAAALRAEPDNKKFIGQSVEWTLQVLAIQKADELRPEIPLGTSYILARGPLPEAGLVYLVVTEDDVKQFSSLGPLAKIRVLATIRAARARHLPTPVLDFVRRIN